MESTKEWFVYMIETSCGKFYTGITTDLDRRFTEHNDVFEGRGNKGAKFFRGHHPAKIIHSETYNSRSEASKREYQIKAMTKRDKTHLLNSMTKHN